MGKSATALQRCKTPTQEALLTNKSKRGARRVLFNPATDFIYRGWRVLSNGNAKRDQPAKSETRHPNIFLGHLRLD